MGQLKYLLDSNILSEPARLKPDNAVLQQFATHDGEYATAATVWNELLYGLMILPYDLAAASWYAKQCARLDRQGKAGAYADGEIAAITATHDLTLVTRNLKDFENFEGLILDNWFEAL